MDHQLRRNQNYRHQLQYQHRRQSGHQWHVVYAMVGVMGFAEGRIPCFNDNRGTIQAAAKVGFRGHTKHVDIMLGCTRDFVDKGVIDLKYVRTKKRNTICDEVH